MPIRCPKCNNKWLHRSRLTTWYARLWSRTTGRVPMRCHSCRSRSWYPGAALTEEDNRLIPRDLTKTEPEGTDSGRSRTDL